MYKMATVSPIFTEVERKAEGAEVFKHNHKASKWQSQNANAVYVF